MASQQARWSLLCCPTGSLSEAMSLPGWHRQIHRMVHQALLSDPVPQDVVRKAEVMSGTATFPAGGIQGTFSPINSASGYEITYPSGESAFPDPGEMNRTTDVSGTNQMQLLATVVTAGTSGSTLKVDSDAFETLPVVPLDSPGVKLSSWCNIAGAATLASLLWKITASSGGSAVLGLVQLRER